MTGEAGERERLLAVALADFLDRRARGEAIDPESFCRLHADLAAELEPQLHALAEIDALADGHAAAPAMPERLSGYRVLCEIGSGGMGRVFLALDERLNRRVAIKTLGPRYADNAALRTRFMQEARAMARLAHPNIARIYSLGPDGEPPHFVMEHVEGASLTDAAHALTFQQRAALMQKVALAVEVLHQHGVIHRDLKPANVLVGADLEPKLLDFGLSLDVADREERLTRPGEVMGTPDYFSPEQASGGELDARSDVFSLGAMLYELLTGEPPFRSAGIDEQIRTICEADPVLPRRIDPEVPGDLQNICIKALEKAPVERYSSAREMAADLERFLAGEAVLASPRSYSRMVAGRAGQHLRELEGWRRDRILSDSEYDALRKAYDRLAEREDAWIMEVRRLTLPQVSLYLGAWVLVAGAALIVLFRYRELSGTPAVLAVGAAAVPALWVGVRCWNSGRHRIGIAYLLAFCLLLPITLLAVMGEYGVFSGFTQGKEKLELFSMLPLFKPTTNAQLWWALFVSLPAYYWLRRFTRAPVFSLALAAAGAMLALVTLIRLGMLEWIESDPGRPYFYLIPCALLFMGSGAVLERLRYPADSRYFYPIAVAFTMMALTGLAIFHEPYPKWLNATAPWTRGQLEYLFIVNAGIYFALQVVCERFSSPQMRAVAKAFRFLIPGHVMTSLLLLGLAATERWGESPADAGMRFEARMLEVLLPAVACCFVFGSVPKQMKNFFASGLLFLAIGVVRLQQNLLKDSALWPLGLIAIGTLLMLAAARYAPLRLAFARWRRTI